MTAPVVFGHLYLAPMLGELLHQFPELSLDLSLTNRFVDLIEEGMDLAIRIGQLADSRLIARRLCTNHRVLVASPSYIERWGMPERPEDLARHQCVLFNGFPKPAEWKLVGPGRPGHRRRRGPRRHEQRRDADRAAKQGLGITVGATLSVGPALLSGELVRVLSDYEFEPTAVFAVYTSARQLSTKIRAAVDFLVEKLSDPPSWDQLPPRQGRGVLGPAMDSAAGVPRRCLVLRCQLAMPASRSARSVPLGGGGGRGPPRPSEQGSESSAATTDAAELTSGRGGPRPPPRSR